MNRIIKIGMDVHTTNYTLCIFEPSFEHDGTVHCITQVKPEIKNIIHVIEAFKKKHENEELNIVCGYEAGCLGYSLYWQLAEKGIECDILAPSTMHRSAKNKVVKNDRRDAKNIAANLANGTYKSVYVPTDEDVEIKEYIRMMHDFKIELKKVKQHINAFLLRLGHHYPGKSKWIPAHIKWVKELELSDMYRGILKNKTIKMEKA